MRRRLFPALFSAMAILIAAPAGAASPSLYGDLAAIEARVAAIGFRLTTANALWCPALQPQFGWLLGDRRLYDDRRWPQARLAYGASDADAPFVAALARHGPAAQAGLSVGDVVADVGSAPPAAPGDTDPFARIAALERSVAALPAGAGARVTTADGGVLAVAIVEGCASDFRVEARDGAGAGADGKIVRINAGLAQLTDDDAELAAAIAHELAHNILRHPARLDAAGVDRGLLKQFGRSARLIRQTEVEADRLAVWLLYGAGYDPQAAVRFWEKFGRTKGLVLIQPGTHPRWKARVKSVEQEIVLLQAALLGGALPIPPLIAAPPPLE